MTFIRCDYLTVGEAMELEHLGFILHLIQVGEFKDLYQIYAKEG